MTAALPRPRRGTAGFLDTEPVFQSHPLLEGAAARMPLFGDTGEWDFNGVVRRPARLPPSGWKLRFSHALTAPAWNLLARETLMIMANPRHPVVTGAGLSLKARPYSPVTLTYEVSHLRALAAWGDSHRLPEHLARWDMADVTGFIDQMRQTAAPATVCVYISLLKRLHLYAPALTGGGLPVDPWHRKSAMKAANAVPTGQISTPVIRPEAWFPLVRAAWSWVFTPADNHGCRDTVYGERMVDAFIAHVNATRARTGLAEIPAGRIRPHMFRRTMAMLTDQFAGSEIALGIQLKHVATRALANRSTLGYAAAGHAWAGHLDSAIEAARFRRLEDLYQSHKNGTPPGSGPGGQRLAAAFDQITATTAARGGDAATERSLLKQAGISIRFGTLNHCLFDPANPAGALCLEQATTPPGHDGPLPDRCRPGRCGNSIIGPGHLPLYQARRQGLLQLISTPRLPAPREELLNRELAEIDTIITRAQPGGTP